jgi:hypothetical protein
MNKEQIIEIQKKIGTTPDGFWGQKSIKALQKYLTSLMPNPNPWPKSDLKSMTAFYGNPGDESNLVTVEFPFQTFYEGKKVSKFRCHRKCWESLVKILSNINAKYSHNRDIMEEAEDYGGCYNYRVKRGGNSLSTHAWGVAIDLDADDNSFKDSWPMQSDMPLEIMEEFAKEGWLSAGAFWGYDAMHFQCTRS